ncbi:AsmA family protein [Dyella ginsengisoli]|uniref:AsmA family protein n=1 Tax=Dyella ginsengisoli TaxID=363848 RepID=A0ABW8JRJ1_9GAMM
MTRSRKVLVWTTGIVLGLVITLALVVALFDWNRLKPFIDDKVSQAIGRPFVIHGDLSVAWQREPEAGGLQALLPWPQFTARDITIGNPDWAKQPQFAQLKALRFRLSPLPLLAHRLVVPSLRLVQPVIDLERDAKARNNWSFAPPRDHASSAWKLELGEVGFDRGKVAFDDAVTQARLAIDVEPLQQAIPYAQIVAQTSDDARAQARSSAGAGSGKALAGDDRDKDADDTAARANATRYQFEWRASGTYQGAPANGHGRVGAVLALRQTDRPFPLQARLQVGDTHIVLVGTLTDPLHLGALDLRLWFAGSSMAKLYPLLGLTLPDTRPYATAGHLRAELHRGSGSTFRYDAFRARVGDSDLAGNITVTTGGARPKLTGSLHATLLQFSDLAPLIGADSNAQDKQRADGGSQRADKVLPAKRFRTERWQAMDADVQFDAARIAHGEALPIDSLSTHLQLDDGRLTLDPLRFGVASGDVRGTLALDGRRTPMQGHVALAAQHLKLKALFPTFETMRTSLGELNGRADLDASGNSVAALLGSADGEVKLLMNDGAISRNLLETAGLNVGNIILGKLFGDRTVQINCAATDLAATDGLFRTRLFVFDTDDAVISVDGTVNMASETLDLDVKPQTKGLRIFSLRSPLYVRGTLKHPDVGVQAGPLALRAGGAIALGTVAAPAAALLALISPTHDQPENTCQTVLGQLRSSGKLRVSEPKKSTQP